MSYFNTFESLGNSKTLWNEFQKIMPPSNIFLTFEWFNTLLHSQTKLPKLNIMILQNKETGIEGIAPLIQRGETITFLGDSNICDYQDFLVDPHKYSVFFSHLINYLIEKKWENLCFQDIPEHSKTLTIFVDLCKQNNWDINILEQNICPEIRLTNSWEKYLLNLSKKQRHEARRKINNLIKTKNYSWEILQGEKINEGSFETFLNLAKKSSPEKKIFFSSGYINLFKQIFQNLKKDSILNLSFLKIDGIPVSSNIMFDYRNKRMLYNSGFNPEFKNLSVGIINTYFCIKDAIEKKFDSFDFLKGNEDYKFKLGANKITKIYTINVSKNT